MFRSNVPLVWHCCIPDGFLLQTIEGEWLEVGQDGQLRQSGTTHMVKEQLRFCRYISQKVSWQSHANKICKFCAKICEIWNIYLFNTAFPHILAKLCINVPTAHICFENYCSPATVFCVLWWYQVWSPTGFVPTETVFSIFRRFCLESIEATIWLQMVEQFLNTSDHTLQMSNIYLQ